MLKKENLKSYIDELIKEIEEELDESTATGAVDGYQTPFAFSGKRKQDKEKADSNIEVTGYTKVKDIDESIIMEKQFKGLNDISDTTPLTKITDAQKLKIITASGNIIDFFVPKGKDRNFWQVISSGKVVKSSSGGSVMLKGKGFLNSPVFDSINDLINGVNWDSMERRRRFNESVNEKTDIKWQDVEVGDVANVKGLNKTGLIIKTYGRKFHLKFSNGTTKTYDASELTFIKNESVNEGKVKRPVNRWLELKNDETMHANKKLAVGLRELKYQLSEVEKFFRWYNQIKTMNELSSDGFWKRTHSHIYKIKERLINIAKTIQEIEK
jgi:hypothetical protein